MTNKCCPKCLQEYSELTEICPFCQEKTIDKGLAKNDAPKNPTSVNPGNPVVITSSSWKSYAVAVIVFVIMASVFFLSSASKQILSWFIHMPQPVYVSPAPEFKAPQSPGLVEMPVSYVETLSDGSALSDEAGPVITYPHALNIDFGPWKGAPSKQEGPAAIGSQGDFWNVVGVPWNDDHIEAGLKSARGMSSPIKVGMVNLGGGWGSNGRMGVGSPMLDNFNYPANNKGGNSGVFLYHIPPGKYDIYVYGHGADPVYYGDYTLSVGGRDYGRKTTSHQMDPILNTYWVEGSQYVKFSNVDVYSSEIMRIFIQPGGQVSDGARTFSDAMICGLQIVPA